MRKQSPNPTHVDMLKECISRLAIVSHDEAYEWLLLDLALLSIGAITVPIYEYDSAAQIEHILTDAHVTRVFTASTQQARPAGWRSPTGPS